MFHMGCNEMLKEIRRCNLKLFIVRDRNRILFSLGAKQEFYHFDNLSTKE